MKPSTTGTPRIWSFWFNVGGRRWPLPANVRCMKALIALVGLLALVTAPVIAMTTDSASILALIKATSAFRLDRSIAPPGTLDSKTHPYVHFVKDEHLAGGFPDAQYASIGRMSDGTQVLAVPLFSGGSGGVFTQLIFAQKVDGDPFFVGYLTSEGHLAVNVTYHGIVAILPKYGPSDPNCCPSKFETDVYTIVDRSLKLITQRISTKP